MYRGATSAERQRQGGVSESTLFRRWRSVLALALLFGGATGWSCSQARPQRPNILFVLIDTLRADHLGAYGYIRPTSPTIDRLAEEKGVLFERFYSVAPWTNPAIVTLFTGLYPQSVLPPALHKEAITQALPTAVETLPEALSRGGYRTVALVDHPGINRGIGFARGFDEFHHLFQEEGIEKPWKTSSSPEFVLAAFEAALAGSGEEPFFIYLHLIYPHRPYLPQPAYEGLFGEGSWENRPEERPKLINNYDAEIRQTDDLLGRVFATLEARDLSVDTAIIITSDHGEGFWEHGIAEHGRGFFDEMIRIPLVFVPPGGRSEEPAVVTIPASNIDLFPTLLELAGVEPSLEPQGRSLFRFFSQPDPPLAADTEWFFSESPHSPDLRSAAALGTNNMKYVHSPGSSAENRLFDLATDGEELNDLGPTEAVAAHRAILDEHRRRNRSLRQQWRVEEIELDEETLRRLQALGYVD